MTSLTPPPRSKGVLAILFALLAVAPLVLLLSCAIARRWLDEDAFINLRIVRNMLAGHGPVFNLDERVEAGTSPLWLFILALLGAFRLPLEATAAYLGIALTLLGFVAAGLAALRTEGDERMSLAHKLTRPALPIGALVFAAIPATWDYASSGLETGLTMGWLGVVYWALSRAVFDGTRNERRTLATAFILGLGPMVRPELALYATLFFAVFAAATFAERPFGTAFAVMVRNVVVALALPVAYQLFRMGYFANTVPNTALAKEAFLTNWDQGKFYLENFYETYRLEWPCACALVAWLIRLATTRWSFSWRSAARLLFIATPTIAATLHILYLVRIGGDYMHGRLLVPATFAWLMPVMTLPIPAWKPRLAPALSLLTWTVSLPWVVYCAMSLRVNKENAHDIGDERGWYARESHNDNPIALKDFKSHSFYHDGERCQTNIDHTCPSHAPDCRKVYVDDDGKQTPPIAEGMDARITAVCPLGAVGISGYVLPDSVHVEDHHGLSDPFVGRFRLDKRGRPGHEKQMSSTWLEARFSAPSPDDNGDILAARHALSCGDLARIDAAVRAPLTFARFMENVKNASSFAKVRIPADPSEAEEQFCGTPHRRDVTTGGGGGDQFHSLCAPGQTLFGVKGTSKAKDKAIASIEAECAVESDAGGEAIAHVTIGPKFGEKADDPFELTCPPGWAVGGLVGKSDKWARSIGLTCLKAGNPMSPLTTTVEGSEVGNDYTLACPNGGKAVGIAGRGGALIDAIGVVCGG